MTNSKMDFAIILFNSKTEILLARILAASFKYINKDIINKIFLVYNDVDTLDFAIQSKVFDDVLPFFPESLRPSVSIISSQHIGVNVSRSDWFNQQLVKIVISKIISTSYYVILDAKNHFIRHIDLDYFFTDDGKVKYNFQHHNDEMLKYYFSCLSYFEVQCPYASNFPERLKFQTVTPFIFETREVRSMIERTERKEGVAFNEFFLNSKYYTEFFFYFSHLLNSNRLTQISVSHEVRFTTIGRADPMVFDFNSFEVKNNLILNNISLKTFGLHRGALEFLDNDYKYKADSSTKCNDDQPREGG